jgi:hypothetical protein
MKILSAFILLFFIATTSISFSQEKAEKHSILINKYKFGIGLFYPSKSIDIGADGSFPNDDIEFSEAFGFRNSETTLFLSFDWRFSKKWKLSTEYFGLKNAGKGVLQEDINWDDLIFKEGTNVKGGIDFNIYRIYVGRIFTSGQKHEFGGGFGIHAMNASAFLEGDVLTNEGDLSFEKSRKTITLPLPNLGLWYFYAPNKKWAFTTRLDYFALSIGDFSGRLLNITPSIGYQIFKHIGVALNYRYIDIGAKFDSSNWKGDIDIIFQGPSFRITGNF